MRRSCLHFLDDIRDACGNILTYTRGMSYREFASDRLTQDAVIRNFEVIGEAVKNLPEEFRARYPSVAWKQVCRSPGYIGARVLPCRLRSCLGDHYRKDTRF
jgi:uncharacterized protein with HEPN domain